MTDLATIALRETPSTGVQFRREPYGPGGLRDFLRDLIAMANAAIDGSRYIIVGVEFDEGGARRLHSVPRRDFTGKPSYSSLVADFVEPPIRLRYQRVTVEDKTLGVYEIGDCQNKPYMMRIDHSETLRRGDAYVRIDDAVVKMGRRLLQDLFEQRFRDAAARGRIEIGFPGDIIHKDLKVATVDLSELPSVVASARLRQMIYVRCSPGHAGSTTTIARLAHARLFGPDDPYVDRSPTVLMAEKAQIHDRHRDDDLHFLFEEHGQPLQLVIYNQGEEPVRDAALTVSMPRHDALYVAEKLPKARHDGKYAERSEAEQAAYPRLTLSDQSVHIAANVGDIPTDAPVNAFRYPVRICVGSDLAGRRVAIRYSLIGRNLRTPVNGKLRLLF